MTRPDKNCPGKKSKLELSNKMRNFINFRVDILILLFYTSLSLSTSSFKFTTKYYAWLVTQSSTGLNSRFSLLHAPVDFDVTRITKDVVRILVLQPTAEVHKAGCFSIHTHTILFQLGQYFVVHLVTNNGLLAMMNY
jgi:hypothetical protein